jgi:hypothetical protein
MRSGSNVILALAGLLCLTACSNGDAEDHRELNLIVDAENSVDTLTPQLVRSQQNLLRAISEDNAEVMAQLMAPRFIVHDVRVIDPPQAGAGGVPNARQSLYMEVMAGKLQESVRPAYSAYHAIHQGDQIIVYALDLEDAIRAVWERTEAGWVATQFILTSSDEARRLMMNDGP